LQQVASGLDNGDGDAGVGEAHRNAATHRAGPDDRAARDRARLCPIRDARHFGRLALGEKDMTLRLGLIAGDQFAKQVGFAPQPFVEGQDDGVAHRFNTGGGRFPAAQSPGQRLGRISKPLPDQLSLAIADEAQRPPLANNTTREVDRSRGQVAFDNLVDDSIFPRLGRSDRLAGHDHPQCLLRSDKARQPLGAARTGQQAELDLGQTDACSRHRDTEVAGERQFEAAAQSGAVQRRDDRLRHRLDRGDDVVKARRLGRLAEFCNVGAGEEGAAGAGNHHRLDCIVVARLGQRLSESGPHLVLQRIDRRVVGGDDRDFTVATEIDAGVDAAHDTPRC